MQKMQKMHLCMFLHIPAYFLHILLHIRCISGEYFCIFSAYFVHILCIFCAYFLHMSACKVHIRCIFFAYVCIFSSYSVHILCIFFAYFLNSCAYFWHMFAYSAYSVRILAYLLHMPALRLRPCFFGPPDPRPCLASGGGQARLRHANGSASGPHHPFPPNTSHQSSRISGPSVEITAPPAPCGPADCRTRSASQAFHPSASCSLTRLVLVNNLTPPCLPLLLCHDGFLSH
jgi:hypothetical protein